MESVKIEPLRDELIPQLIELLAVQLREHHMPVTSSGLSTVVDAVLADPKLGFFLVSLDKNNLTGFAFGTSIISAEHEGMVVWLEEFYVRPDQRNKGIGKALLEAFYAKAQSSGAKAIELEVDKDHSKVINLYEREGFLPLPRARMVKKLN